MSQQFNPQFCHPPAAQDAAADRVTAPVVAGQGGGSRVDEVARRKAYRSARQREQDRLMFIAFFLGLFLGTLLLATLLNTWQILTESVWPTVAPVLGCIIRLEGV